MTTQVVPFLFETASPVRAFVDDHGNPWFCAKDVCEILGYSATSAMNKLLDDEDRDFHTFLDGTTYKKQSRLASALNPQDPLRRVFY